MKIILLLPIVAYVALVVFNMDILSHSEPINFFTIWQIEAPVLLYVNAFFILYIVFLFIVFDIKWAFLNRKIDKLENEIFSLKSQLYDEREDILKTFIAEYKTKMDNFTKEQESLFEKFKSENEMDLLKQKSETDRILEKLNLLDKSIFDKIKETFKNKN